MHAARDLSLIGSFLNTGICDDPGIENINAQWKSPLNLSTMAVNVAFLVHRKNGRKRNTHADTSHLPPRVSFNSRRRCIRITCPDRTGAQCPRHPPAARFSPPASPRSRINFNLNWRFIREDVPGAEAPDFDDSHWTTVSTPHSFNDVDSFRKIISHSGGDLGTYKGLSWYRKHFKLPARLLGRKIFLEFEGMRQAGDIFLNGKRSASTRTASPPMASTSPTQCTSAARRTCWR